MEDVLLYPISDIHADALSGNQFGRFIEYIEQAGADVVAIAGDMALGREAVVYLERFLKAVRGLPVIYLPGNYEFSDSDYTPEEFSHDIRQLETRVDNLLYLQNRRIGLEDSTSGIVGSTLWFPPADPDPEYEEKLSELYLSHLTPWIYEEHKKACDFLLETIQEGDIVVTHYIPTRAGVIKKFRGDYLNRFFVADIAEIVRDTKPRVWIHGHTHYFMEYYIGKTRCICNPVGFVHEFCNASCRPGAGIKIDGLPKPVH